MSRDSKHASESAAAALAAPQRSGPRKSKQPPVQRKPPVHGRESHAERWGQGKLLPSSPQMPRRHWQGGPAGPDVAGSLARPQAHAHTADHDGWALGRVSFGSRPSLERQSPGRMLQRRPCSQSRTIKRSSPALQTA